MKSTLPRFSAVIFDMDGLVLDSEPSYAFAWRHAADEFGARLEDEFVRGLFGRQTADVERALAEQIGEGFDSGRFRQDAARYWWAHVETHGIPAMPGVNELLELLTRNRIPYSLATNSEGLYARECLRRGGLEEAFPVVVTRDQVAAGKPEPDLILEAARRMDVLSAHCLVLEDSATGLLAAGRAGAIPVLVLARPAQEDLKALAALSYRSLHEIVDDIRPLMGLDSSPNSNLRRKP